MVLAVKLTLSAALTILAGILVLAWPKLIRVLLGIYLIVIGVLNLVEF